MWVCGEMYLCVLGIMPERPRHYLVPSGAGHMHINHRPTSSSRQVLGPSPGHAEVHTACRRKRSTLRCETTSRTSSLASRTERCGRATSTCARQIRHAPPAERSTSATSAHASADRARRWQAQRRTRSTRTCSNRREPHTMRVHAPALSRNQGLGRTRRPGAGSGSSALVTMARRQHGRERVCAGE